MGGTHVEGTRRGGFGALRQMARDPLMRTIAALGIVEIIAWGTTFYSLGVLGGPIAAATGWDRSLVFAGITIGLLVSSALSSWAGRVIDSKGGRFVMSIGTCAAAAGHGLLAVSPTPFAYLAGWVLLGAAMRFTLYDAAFAALVQVAPAAKARLAISYLTLFGGFASSVFWPIGHALAEFAGWRLTMAIYTGLDLGVCLPLILVGLSGSRTVQHVHDDGQSSVQSQSDGKHLSGRKRLVAIVLFGVAMSLNAFVWGATMAHIVALLKSTGVPEGTAVAASALMGVAQVAARIWDTFIVRGVQALNLGRIALFLLPFAMVLPLLAGPPLGRAIAFPILLGLSNGLVTIVRGAVPLALFGSAGFGQLLGRLATPQLFMNAIAPMIFAAFVDFAGLTSGQIALLVGAIASAMAMEATIRWAKTP